MMNRNYKFRLYPSRNQEAELIQTLDGCRWLYNHFLEQWNGKEKIPSRFELQVQLPKLALEHDFIGSIHSKSRQYVLYQLYSNLRALSQLKKRGKKVGRLRFKGRDRYNCFVYNQTGYKIIETGNRLDKLHLSKIGDISIRLHRKVEGNIKQVFVKRTQTGKWFAILSVEEDETILRKNNKEIGIDLNIMNYLTDSEGDVVEHPHHLRRLERKLKRDQRRLSKKKKGSNNRFKQKYRIARVHEKVVDARDDFLHKLSNHYVQNYGFIGVEDLSVKDMMQSSWNAVNISDSSWSTFIQMLSYKAESAGRTFVKVDPKNTTQDCSGCGSRVYKQLWVRTHSCPSCGLELNRDHNAAINVLNKARNEIGQGLSEYTPVEIEPLPLASCQWQVPSLNQEASSFRER